MERNLQALAGEPFDLAVIGGGVNGLCAAWDAAMRGLRVALVEKNDFGGATSAGTFHIVHGGFRYLQNLDLPRLRASVRERRWMLRAAPHLVHPIPFLVPCRGHGLRGPEAFLAAGGMRGRQYLTLTDGAVSPTIPDWGLILYPFDIRQL